MIMQDARQQIAARETRRRCESAAEATGDYARATASAEAGLTSSGELEGKAVQTKEDLVNAVNATLRSLQKPPDTVADSSPHLHASMPLHEALFP